MAKATFLASFVRPGGDDEELRLTFAVPQTEIPKAVAVLLMGKHTLKITVETDDTIIAKGRFVEG